MEDTKSANFRAAKTSSGAITIALVAVALVLGVATTMAWSRVHARDAVVAKNQSQLKQSATDLSLLQTQLGEANAKAAALQKQFEVAQQNATDLQTQLDETKLAKTGLDKQLTEAKAATAAT